MIEPRTLCSFFGTIDVIGRAGSAILALGKFGAVEDWEVAVRCCSALEWLALVEE